ncbi:MAG: class I SAM-dependent methyltransferase [Bacillota bacterium]|nr:class I SAM-dependent methyltransferase [Bacillota bacterium]
MNSYEFSEVYDVLMKDVPYERWTNFIDARLKGFREIAEIGCGTGEITRRLGDKNYKVTAVDVSENMLVKAYEKLRRMPNIKVMKGDGRNLKIDQKFDAVLSTCDVVNYMLEDKDLEQFIKNSHKLLKDGGYIIFDISSYYKIKNILSNNTFVNEEEGIFYVWENSFDEKKCISEMNLNFFIKEDNNYKRIIETQHQRAYKEEEIIDVLEKNRFKDIKVFDNYNEKNPNKKSERIVFTAIRR